ncbi:hypothetical protein [Actinomadura hibisca]|uniref:hypothetical protein n=1 Tax=Actinomadura hibisca TaxID=68565 RepID=UPI0008308B4E|nr:hypothetical protein [Actinomadura hibisca]
MNEADLFRARLLLDRVQALSDEHWHLLAGPARAMGDHAWVGGPSASGFAGELQRNQAELQAQLRRSLALIQEKLRTPLAR